MSENGKYDGEATGAGSTDDAEVEAEAVSELVESGDLEVLDDPDEPQHPDEATRAGVEAARIALRPSAPRRPYKGPRSISIMLLILGLIVAVGVYGIQWALRMHDKNEHYDLRELEERDVMAGWQQKYVRLKFGPDSDVAPPGKVWEPLKPDERARAEALRARFGSQFKPDEKQRMLIDEVEALQAQRGPPASGPGTMP
jgi:hypothetical protein